MRLIKILTALLLGLCLLSAPTPASAEAPPQRDTESCADHGEVNWQQLNLPALWGDVRQKLDPGALVIKHYRDDRIIRGYFRPCWASNTKLVLVMIDYPGVQGIPTVFGGPGTNLCTVNSATDHGCNTRTTQPREKRCDDYHATDSDGFNAAGARIAVAGGAGYTFCLFRHKRDAAMTHVFAASLAAVEHDTLNCLWLDGVRINFEAFDSRGHRVNPGPIWIPCRSDQRQVDKRVFIHRKVWLKHYGDGAPQWTAHFEAVIDAHPNYHGLIRSAMLPMPDIWPFREAA